MKLSIITINFNNLQGLQRTVESVVNQTWQEFEYIIIDGGSTDGSAEYIESQSKHLDYWVSEPDAGIYNAMNKGIAKATGEYLLFLNSGDHLFGNAVLAENHNFIKDFDLIYFDIQFVEDSKSWIVKYPQKLAFSHFIYDTLPHPATFIKASLFTAVGLYDESLQIVSDWKFFIIALFKNNCSYSQIEAVLSTFNLDGISSRTVNRPFIQQEREKVLNTYFKGCVEDSLELFALRCTISNLRKSRKIKWLVKLRFIHKF